MPLGIEEQGSGDTVKLSLYLCRYSCKHASNKGSNTRNTLAFMLL